AMPRAALLAVLLLLQQQIAPVPPLPPAFDEWLKGVRTEALTRGIKPATLDSAFDGLQPLPIVVERDRSQAELVFSLDKYLRQHLTAKLTLTARKMRTEHADVLKEVADKYGVPPEIVIAV